MNTANKLDFLTDRVAAVGEKLAAKLAAGSIPSKAEMSFLDECVLSLMKVAPSHAIRLTVLDLHAAVNAATDRRDSWRAQRAAALAQAEKVRQAKIRSSRQARLAIVTSQRKSVVSVAAIVNEIKAERAMTLPTGTTAQGLPFVVELPLEWQDDKVIA